MLGQIEVFHSENSRDAKLLTLGLSHEALINAVGQGQASRNTATSNHPSNAAGTMAFFEVVRALRDELKLEGWQKKDIRNLSMTVNPETNVSIVVSGGNKETGLVGDGITPKTRNPKGEQTKCYLAGNQPDLFDDAIYNPAPENAASLTDVGQTWMLLYYFDQVKREVRSELSLPTEIDSFGRVAGWKQRIILGSIQLDKEYIDIAPDLSPDIDIDIQIKA